MVLRNSTPFKADSQFEIAVEMNPESAISRYSYAQFLISEEDFDRADEQISKAITIDSNDNALKTCKAWVLTLSGDYNNASKAYEELIPNQKNQLRKFRISTFDQASTCYRRMGEQYTKDGDLTEAKSCLARSVSILINSIEDGDYDHGTVSKLVSLLTPIDNLGRKNGDYDLTDVVFEALYAHRAKFDVKSLQVVASSIDRYAFSCSDSISDKVRKFQGIVTPVFESNEGSRILGTVSRTVEKGQGISYGFIDGINDIEYFFHRNELKPRNILDTHSDAGDSDAVNVTFKPSENEKGYCALEITLVEG